MWTTHNTKYCQHFPLFLILFALSLLRHSFFFLTQLTSCRIVLIILMCTTKKWLMNSRPLLFFSSFSFPRRFHVSILLHVWRDDALVCRGRRQRIILVFSDWMCHVSGMQLEINQPKLSPIPFHCCCCCLYDERELPTYNILRYYAISAAHIYHHHHHRCRLRRHHHCDRKSMTMKRLFFYSQGRRRVASSLLSWALTDCFFWFFALLLSSRSTQ